ncbi:MAG: carbohydrate ABC transporter permease [Anaerolineales bacterium]|jgi:multiple sugar transport system permease protein|nr:carbohydrate ABC transporter permease [Anaerolineales bacterium]
MSKIGTPRPDSRPTLLQRWKHFRIRTVGDTGILGFGLRWGVLLLFAAYFFVPILWLVLATSKSAPQLLELKPLAFGSFERIQEAWRRIIEYQNGEVLLWASNSIRYALWALTLSLATSIPAGYILAVARFPGRRLLLWLTLVTMLLPPSALVLPMFMELNLFRLINTQWAVILPSAFFPFGTYLTYIYYASSLPSELLDAARVDGCSEAQLFWHIALPLATPVLGLLAFINFTTNWNNFFGPYVLLNDDRLFNLPVGIQQFVAATSALRPGFNPSPGVMVGYQQAEAALFGLIMVVPVAIVFLFAQRYVIGGAFTGSVKG